MTVNLDPESLRKGFVSDFWFFMSELDDDMGRLRRLRKGVFHELAKNDAHYCIGMMRAARQAITALKGDRS